MNARERYNKLKESLEKVRSEETKILEEMERVYWEVAQDEQECSPGVSEA